MSHRPLLLGLGPASRHWLLVLELTRTWSADLGPLGLNLSPLEYSAASPRPRARIRTFRAWRGPCTHSTWWSQAGLAVNRQTLHVLKWAQSGYHPLSLKSNATFRCTSPSPLFGARACLLHEAPSGHRPQWALRRA
nr:hypothetical protein [uncultured bacterium]